MRKAAAYAVIFDLGSVKIIDTADGPICECVPSWETMFDPIDGRRKKTIRVQRFPADKDALIAEFCKLDEDDKEDAEKQADMRELADEIRSSTPSGMTTSDHTMSDQHCIVFELWRLPVGRTKGRHVVITDNALLLDEEWSDKTFNFVDFGFSFDPIRPYPVSIAEINMANQDELDGVGMRISQILRLCAVPQYLETGPNAEGPTTVTQVRGGTDAIGDIIQVAPGKALERMPAGPVVGPELFSHEDRVWSRGFQMVGINEQSAVGSRPMGLNSAPAQREWNEIAQDRLSLVALDYQEAHVELAQRLLDSVARIPTFEIQIQDPNGKWLKKLKVEDMHLDRADYVIQPFPVSALPSTPTGRLAAAADLLQMGAITRDQFMEMVQIPDLKAKLNVTLESRRAVEKIIAKMMSEERYIAPSDRFDLDYALEYATAQWLKGLADDMPDQQLGRLDDWINNVVALKRKAAAGATAAPPAPNLAGTSLAPVAPQPLAAPVSAQDIGATMPAAA